MGGHNRPPLLAIPQKYIFMVCLCGLTSPKNFDKESARRSIGQSDTFNMRRACGLIRQDPGKGRAILSAHRRRQEETAAAMTRILV